VKVREVAARLEVSPATVYALIAAGKLRHCRIGNGRGVLRILDEHLQEYLRNAEPKASAPPAPFPRIKLKHLRVN
jgi:excisionase family DNA binding protein